jgi:hypothetical protein
VVLDKLNAAIAGGGTSKSASAAAAMKERVLAGRAQTAVGLDVGRSGVRCVVCGLDSEQFYFLGCGAAESKGWNRGRVHDQQAITESVRAAVDEAERTTGVPVSAAVVVGGMTVQATTYAAFANSAARVSRGSDYAIELARACVRGGPLPAQVLPQDFTIDGRAGFRVRRRWCPPEANVHMSLSRQEHRRWLRRAADARRSKSRSSSRSPPDTPPSCPAKRGRGAGGCRRTSSGLAIYEATLVWRPACRWAATISPAVAHCLPASYEAHGG